MDQQINADLRTDRFAAALSLFGNTKVTKFCSDSQYHSLDCGHIIKTHWPEPCLRNCHNYHLNAAQFVSNIAFACPPCDQIDKIEATARADNAYGDFLRDMIPWHDRALFPNPEGMPTHLRPSQEALMNWMYGHGMANGEHPMEHFMATRRYANGRGCALVDERYETEWLLNNFMDSELTSAYYLPVEEFLASEAQSLPMTASETATAATVIVEPSNSTIIRFSEEVESFEAEPAHVEDTLAVVNDETKTGQEQEQSASDEQGVEHISTRLQTTHIRLRRSARLNVRSNKFWTYEFREPHNDLIDEDPAHTAADAGITLRSHRRVV